MKPSTAGQIGSQSNDIALMSTGYGTPLPLYSESRPIENNENDIKQKSPVRETER